MSVRGAVVAEQGTSELAGLLAAGERAAFHGRPEVAEQLTRELTDALSSGRTVTTDVVPR